MSDTCAGSLTWLICIVIYIGSVFTQEVSDGASRKFIDLNLHPSHYPYFFWSHPGIAEDCRQYDSCPYKTDLDKPSCWGYEKGCNEISQFPGYPVCTDIARGWAKDIEAQRELFWSQADFGFIKNTIGSMKVICEPKSKDDSLLECSEFIRHCRAKNLYLDLRELGADKSRNRFSVEAFNKPGVVGGHCKLDREYLKSQSKHFSELQSWYGELNEYTEFSFKPVKHKRKCDVVITRPTFFMKLDAGVNMYHHFCDFINLYMSQHINGSFSQDINIVMWDASYMNYGELFFDTWSAFTDTHFIPLKEWDGKKVCIADGVFSLLPRMQRGMYYNMPLVPNCHSSSLMRSFSQHVLHRLGVTQEGPKKDTIRITLLDRQTKHRNIVNQEELLAELKKIDGIEINVVVYHWKQMKFTDQLQSTHNSDIFIGMHGAGLTHLLFLPDWAVIFEISNCEDKNCYKDLAAIRGVKYMTWENNDLLQKRNEIDHPSLGKPHAKFCDYEFDVPEFRRLMLEAISHVKLHKGFKQHHHDKDEL